ncbi:DUF1810 domain-containing protein [Roseovarius sp. CAU 1744]|uniref:DUF1810 domain-containing protein n=1 Tax=Roseovarius sp. CAU 1744 TaxID=3140368 RepID=UPI00325A46A7
MSLERFIEAQARIWPAPLEEIRAGRKRTHWMWFIFPQLRGLGRSVTAQKYGIEDLTEAREYLAHPVLGARLVTISAALLPHAGHPIEAILGPVDAMKLRSSMTLFQHAGPEAVFNQVLGAFHTGKVCELTRALLEDGKE